ncbi:MAG: hypothetical protein ACTSSO_01235 [Candidatus Hodarchaeales archaeon]
MSQLEINSKKIETLTKVARLLGDQIQAQENLKENVFEDTAFKNSKSGTGNESKFRNSEKPTEKVTIADTSKITVQETPKEKKSEKEELLQALTIIDNL